MVAAHEDLTRQIEALRTRFADLGARALLAAEALAASEPPPATLLEELRGTPLAFAAVRDAVLEHARDLIPPPSVETLGSVQALQPLMAAIAEAEAERARRTAWEAARESALSVLDRVMAVIHREDRDFRPLGDCQAKARGLHAALSGSPPADLEHETQMLPGRVRPFAELMSLVDGWDRLDDERCAFLHDQVTLSFGRQLGLAALRGKLGHEGEVRQPRVRYVEVPAGTPGAPAAAPTAIASAAPTTVAVPGGPATVAVPGGPATPPPMAAGPPIPAEAPATASPLTAAPGSSAGTPMVAVPGAQPLVVEIRLTGDRVQVETPEEKREREALLERLAAESAPWWIRAREAFRGIVDRHLPFGEAAREMLRRFPYLLSVPIQRSPEYDGGRCAEGYAILLQRLDKEEPGFVRDALTRLNPQFTTRARDETYPLGQELYLYVVAEGRLYKAYPDFLREVLEHVLPDPGVWAQASIVDADEQTTVVRNGERPGSRQESSTTLREPGERFTTHLFALTASPLTTRVVTIGAGALKDTTDVEIRLKEGEAASDKAWIVVTPVSGTPEAPRRQRLAGTRVEELGRRARTVAVAVFNSDPNSDRRYELAVTLRRKIVPAAATPDADPPKFAPPRSSPFSTRRR